MNKPEKHFKKTKDIALKLNPNDIYTWLVTVGYYPENYVLPPVFSVTKAPNKLKRYYSYKKNDIKPPIHELIEIHFPKTAYTDRTFGIIEPSIHSDIAFEIAENWVQIIKNLFCSHNKVYSYSFPIPIDLKNPGKIGKLRAGRMIYEYLEMAENDLIDEAYRYKYIVKTDIKNFYPSIYTHSIPWALHGKAFIRRRENRHNYDYFGNRLDKLFQCANDNCTNGIAIGPAVSDLISEIVLSAVDKKLSETFNYDECLCVRFKDDYRILCKDENTASTIINRLQVFLKEYNLVLNEEKTEIKKLPTGLFREWVSEYYKIKPKNRKELTFKEFREFYLNVNEINNKYPEYGVVDRFLSDLRDKDYNPLFPYRMQDIQKSISLLILLSERRLKAFPTILGTIEIALKKMKNKDFNNIVELYLNNLLDDLVKDEQRNRYQISWVIYFLKSNKMNLLQKHSFKDAIIKSINANRGCSIFKHKDFTIYRSIAKSAKALSIIEHTDVFKQQ